jgi:hypothetical protein
MGMRANKKPLARVVAVDGAVTVTCAAPHIAIKAEAAANRARLRFRPIGWRR